MPRYMTPAKTAEAMNLPLKMPHYMTPAKTAEAMKLPLWMLRTKIKKGEVPGFHHGNRFYINVDLFTRQLEEESKKNLKQ